MPTKYILRFEVDLRSSMNSDLLELHMSVPYSVRAPLL